MSVVKIDFEPEDTISLISFKQTQSSIKHLVWGVICSKN